MGNDVIVTDATIIERVEAGSVPRPVGMRFPEMLLWTVISILWFSVIRLIIVGGLGILWVAAGPTEAAARSWLWFGTPLGVTIATFLTMQTHLRNRQLHFVMSIVVFLSAVVFHINLSLNNPFLIHPDPSLSGVAWVLQALAVVVGGAAGLALVRRRRAKWASQPAALPATS